MDEPTTTEPTTPEPERTPEPAATPPTEDLRVPVSEVQKERKARQELQAELTQLRQEADDRRKAELSEVERAKEEREQAAAERDRLQAQLRTRERGDLVTEAARQAGFVNPALASRLVDLNTVEDATAAADAVKQLAKADPYLVATTKTGGSLREVLKDGKPVDSKTITTEDVYSSDELDRLTADEVAANYEKVERSLTALS